MRVTFLGQAGLFIETRGATILCDPWFNPAYFGAWFPFPRNDHLHMNGYLTPDFLYVSHQHRDHFDPLFLATLSKDTTVLLPDFALPDHEHELRNLGFTSFLRFRNGQTEDLDGLRVAIDANTDEPTGDSVLMLDDGETRLLNQNDARPLDLASLAAMGPFDAHFVQFSGAMWFPAVYRWPAQVKEKLVRHTRRAQQARAFNYIDAIGASHVFPSAGPPCFLDESLFYLNDLPGHPASIFPDQTRFLDEMIRSGKTSGRLLVPGTTVEFSSRHAVIAHPMPEDELRHSIFVEKRSYLERYADDRRSQLDAMARDLCEARGLDMEHELATWFEPLLRQADETCAGINGCILLDTEDSQIVIDFQNRCVTPYRGQACKYRFFVRRPIVERLIEHHQADWVNSLFLSCRFEAERDGPYNEWVYSFFKGLTSDRLRHLEYAFAEPPAEDDVWESHGYIIQRRCPHFKADLERFGHIEDGILTCSMHGWQFELESGRCLTAEGRTLRTRRAEE